MPDPTAAPQPVALARRGQLALLCAWCLILLLGALPPEITPDVLSGATGAVQSAFYRASLRSGSFVFSGHRGDSKRRFFALRAVAWRAGGSEVIYETPEGLSWPRLRLTVPLRDTVSLKMLDFDAVSRLAGSSDPDERAELLDRLRDGKRSARVGRFFCRSSLFSAARRRESVSVEIYDATVSYATGALTPHRETVLHYDCRANRLRQDWPYPTATPEWPGVTWEGR